MKQNYIKTSCPRDCFGGCTMKVYVDNGTIVKLEGEDSNKATVGKLCIKGMAYMDYVYSQSRIKYPMIRVGDRGEGRFERVSWEYAIKEIGDKLKHVKDNFGPSGLMYYGSGGCQGLMSQYYQSFFSQFGGYSTTRGNLCYSAGIEATRITYGDALHNAPWDLENAGLVILWGKNPAFTNVQEMKFINKAITNGGKLITIDPIKNASSGRSNLHISPKPGSDGALALGIINQLIKHNTIDLEFIKNYTHGFEALKSHVQKYTPCAVAKICQIDENEIYSMVNIIESSKPMTLVCGYGIQRYKNAGQTVRAISMLPAIIGNVGIKGGGFRFANKQWENLKWPHIMKRSVDEIRDEYPSAALGKALDEYKNPEIKMLWIERANPLTMNPDINSLKNAMNNVEYIVTVDQFITDTARFSDIILPAQSFFEYEDVFTGYWTPYLSYCSKIIEPFYESKNESQIYRLLGEYMEYDMDYLPEYNSNTLNSVLKKCGINTSVQELKAQPLMDNNAGDIAFIDRKFNTPTGKIELYSESMYGKWKQSPLPEFCDNIECTELSNKYPLRFLSTHARERIHSQFSEIEKLKTNEGKAILYISPEDAKKRFINDGSKISIYNDNGIIYAYACITKDIKYGVVNLYEGLSECSGASVNMLTNQEISDIGYGATYYDCFVDINLCQQ